MRICVAAPDRRFGCGSGGSVAGSDLHLDWFGAGDVSVPGMVLLCLLIIGESKFLWM